MGNYFFYDLELKFISVIIYEWFEYLKEKVFNISYICEIFL